MRTLVFALVLFLAPHAIADVRVVTSLPSLASIAREVVGDAGQVQALAPPTQDPHFVDGKPSMMLQLNRADLLIDTGLGLEQGWLPPLVEGARNPKLREGQPGRLHAISLIGTPLGVPTTVDRSLGDVHAGGNPHFWYDPRRVRRVAEGIAERLATVDPERADTFRANAARFVTTLDERIPAWEARMAPLRGSAVVPYHDSLVYLRDWLGWSQPATVEPLPGIPPSPSHLAGLILRIREAKPKPVVVAEPWYDRRTANTVAQKASTTLVILPGDVGATRETGTYVTWLDEVLKRLQTGLQEAKK